MRRATIIIEPVVPKKTKLLLAFTQVALIILVTLHGEEVGHLNAIRSAYEPDDAINKRWMLLVSLTVIQSIKIVVLSIGIHMKQTATLGVCAVNDVVIAVIQGVAIYLTRDAYGMGSFLISYDTTWKDGAGIVFSIVSAVLTFSLARRSRRRGYEST
jgi:hypothetical protein